MIGDVRACPAIYAGFVPRRSKRWKCGNVQKADRPCPTSWGSFGERAYLCKCYTTHAAAAARQRTTVSVSLCNRFVMCTGRFRIVARGSSVSTLPPATNNPFQVTSNLIGVTRTPLGIFIFERMHIHFSFSKETSPLGYFFFSFFFMNVDSGCKNGERNSRMCILHYYKMYIIMCRLIVINYYVCYY